MPLNFQALILDLPQRFDGGPLSIAGEQNLHTLQKRLRRSKRARESLALSGFETETITHFHHGLSSFQGRQERYTDALTFPILDAEGQPRKRWLRQDLIGVTHQWPTFRELWSAGQPATYWCTPEWGQPEVVICDSIQIGWWLWQMIRGHALEQRLCLIARSSLDNVPAEWLSPHFWKGWSVIHFARSADRRSTLLESTSAGLYGRTVHSVVPPVTNWQTFVTSGGTADQLEHLFQVPLPTSSQSPLSAQPAFRPHVLDVNMTCYAGQLHYPYYRPVELDSADEANGADQTSAVDLVVLRSDGKRFTPFTSPPSRTSITEGSRMPFPGLRVSRMPTPLQSGLTLDPETIEQFVYEQREGLWSEEQDTSYLFNSVYHHLYLQAVAVLPDPDDILILSAVVMLSYVQATFPIVPLVSIVGPASSGKTRLAQAMLELGCNAELASGHITPATVAHLNDSLGGLLILDDLDAALEASPALISLLRTATAQITGRRVFLAGEDTIPRNVFGLKVITSRHPLPLELRQRAMIVPCLPAAKEDVHHFSNHSMGLADQRSLRQRLHLWAFEQIAGLSEQVQKGQRELTSLRAETALPFNLLAHLMGDDAEAMGLTRAMTRYL